MMTNDLSKEQQLQEEEYTYPYHYIPSYKDSAFSQVQYWSWGFRYLGGMQVVLDQLKKEVFESLLDVGCGDGRFLREVTNHYPDIKSLGVDYSEQAIRLAKAMNPSLHYRATNILDERLFEQFDVVTLVEVLEHIPPAQVPDFIQAAATLVKPNGKVILTVPHSNQRVQEKHYQHFTSQKLKELLAPHFRELEFLPFDPVSKVFSLLVRIFGGSGKNYVITNSQLLSWFYQVYINHYLYTNDENKCLRIAVVCRK